MDALSTLANFNPPESITKNKLEEYRKLAPPLLKEICRTASQEIEKVYNESKSLRKSSLSREYSLLVSKTENLIDDLKNLNTVLCEKKEEGGDAQIIISDQHLVDMYKNMPEGERCLLKTDLQIFSYFSKRPSEKICKNTEGTFYNPTVSARELWKFFSDYVYDGDYQGNDCLLRENCNSTLGKGIVSDGSATCITLVKKPDQRKLLMSYNKSENQASTWTSAKETILNAINYLKSIKQTDLPLKTLENSHGTNCDQLLKESSYNSDARSLVTVHTENDKSLIFVELPKKSKKLAEYEVLQKKVLEKLSQNLPAMLNTWNYDRFEILTTEELINRNYDREAACAGDKVIFYYKRVENVNPDVNIEQNVQSVIEQNVQSVTEEPSVRENTFNHIESTKELEKPNESVNHSNQPLDGKKKT
jgi:hypothetical protein